MTPSDPDDTFTGPPTVASVAASPPSLVGSHIHGLEVQSLLGRGGMGEVYKGFDPELQRFVAIKLVGSAAAGDASYAERFRREARSASVIHHPNVAQIYAAGDHEGRPFYLMEYIPGQSLAEVLAQHGPLGGRRCLSFLIQAALGLRAAHRAGIVHRDIKPGNLMLAGGRIKIVDFGLARSVAVDSTLTQTNMVIGTPAYLAPEQALGGEVDHRADIYALGATFYHLLSGDLPFQADTPLGMLMLHAREPLPPLKERSPRVPVAVCAVIERMLAKEPADRYRDYDELLGELHALKTGSGATAAPTRPASPQLPSQTGAASTSGSGGQPLLWVAAAVLFLFGVALIGPALVRSGPEDETPAIGMPAAEGSPEAPLSAAASAASAPSSPRQPSSAQAAEIGRALSSLSTMTGQVDPGGIPGGSDVLEQGGDFDLGSDGTANTRSRDRSNRVPGKSLPPRLEEAARHRGINPVDILNRAQALQTVSRMRTLYTAIQVYEAENGALPRGIGDLQERVGIGPGELYDHWGRPLQLEAARGRIRIISVGEDGRLGSEDDLILENGMMLQGAL